MRYRQHTPILITQPRCSANEAEALRSLVECGAEIIHLRKPFATEEELCRLLERIDPAIYPNLTIHYHPKIARNYHLGGVHVKPDKVGQTVGTLRKSASCHDWQEVKSLMGHADYVFLSPIFDAISKAGYKSAFGEEQLKVLLKERDRPVTVALGGITAKNIGKVRKWGFEGAACLGSVWVTCGRNEIEIEKSMANYLEIKKAWNGTK